MKCDRCKSDRVLILNGKTSDSIWVAFKDFGRYGYVPRIPNIGEDGHGDYIEMEICMECGKVQGDFPVSDERIFDEMEMM